MTTLDILRSAKQASPALAILDSDKKNKALLSMADALEAFSDKILDANNEDLEAAKGSISDVMLDRLRLTPERIKAMADGIREVVELPDPVGAVVESFQRPNGLLIKKVRSPMGVVGIIYESRPNVTSDAAALALKSGNVCVLRGGKEAYRTSRVIVDALRQGLCDVGLPAEFVNILHDTSREGAAELMRATDYVDLLIPRGGAGLIKACVDNAKVPCIQTGTGICHVYVDKNADLDMALNIIENAKTSRPSVCNAAEVLLVSKDVADKFLPMLEKRLVKDRIANGKIPVELRLDADASKIISGSAANENDFDTEFLDYILSVAIVDDVIAATEHIAAHSTHHSEAIISEDPAAVTYFTSAVDSAAVYVNASTRFTDGGEFGLGCEIGISTQKLHARGPMGLCELTTCRYLVFGKGHIR